jgi:hypothetical protein
LGENEIGVMSGYLENKSVWMELAGGAHGRFGLGPGVRIRPRFP